MNVKPKTNLVYGCQEGEATGSVPPHILVLHPHDFTYGRLDKAEWLRNLFLMKTHFPSIEVDVNSLSLIILFILAVVTVVKVKLKFDCQAQTKSTT